MIIAQPFGWVAFDFFHAALKANIIELKSLILRHNRLAQQLILHNLGCESKRKLYATFRQLKKFGNEGLNLKLTKQIAKMLVVVVTQPKITGIRLYVKK